MTRAPVTRSVATAAAWPARACSSALRRCSGAAMRCSAQATSGLPTSTRTPSAKDTPKRKIAATANAAIAPQSVETARTTTDTRCASTPATATSEPVRAKLASSRDAPSGASSRAQSDVRSSCSLRNTAALPIRNWSR